MKTTLIILQSLDGFIAKNLEDDLSWGTKEDKDFFRTTTKKIGTMILGANTYDNMPEQAFLSRFSLVMTSDPKRYQEKEHIHFFKGSAEDALEYLKKIGKKEVAIIGGGSINNQFLRARLVDEIFVTVAPRIFGQGIRGFGDGLLDVKLILNELIPISENELILHYFVEKK